MIVYIYIYIYIYIYDREMREIDKREMNEREI